MVKSDNDKFRDKKEKEFMKLFGEQTKKSSNTTVGQLRQRIVNIKDASKGRIVLFALVEMTFSGHVTTEALDKVLSIVEE